MKTSFTAEEGKKYLDIFDNYINGNLSEFREQIKKLSKINLLKCVSFLINMHGKEYNKKDIFQIFIVYLSY